jgi:hypothetical protein
LTPAARGATFTASFNPPQEAEMEKTLDLALAWVCAAAAQA